MARSRRYPLALEVARTLSPIEPMVSGEPVLARPPHGAAMVRPAIQRPAPMGQERRDADTLASAARYAHFQHGEEGSMMEIGIDEDLFAGLACQVCVDGDVVKATFRVGDDPNLRRLLEAEKGRLRAALESKGMRKVEVVIEA